MDRKRSVSSARWLHEHFSDEYVKETQRHGLRSRAWFKLDELNKSEHLFKSRMTVVDLGAAPGGWSQYAAFQVGKYGKVFACDLSPMEFIDGVDFIQGDFCDEIVLKELLSRIKSNKVGVVMSDMSPSVCGLSVVDVTRSVCLAELAMEMARIVLSSQGSFVVKVFQGDGFEAYIKEVRRFFCKVKICKPEASRGRSREVYIVATGRRF